MNEQINNSLQIEDLTLNPHHIIGVLVSRLKLALEAKYGSAQVERGNKVVTKNDNYYKLGYNDSEITLGTRYSRYVDADHLLRTQMTAIVPQILESYSLKPNPTQLWLCPGMVYRRDVVDRTHVGEPHQMDVWYLTKDRTLTRSDLLELVETIITEISNILSAPLKWRYHETNHHYTEDGIEVEIYYQEKWMEILECGLAGRTLLSNSGLSQYSGLALGMGLDRLAMIVKQIDDIRILRDSDPRIQKQMSTLAKYKPVSKQPAIKRDLSITVAPDYILEDLTEEIMTLLKDKKDLVEEISLLSDTPYEQLPLIARERLGIKVGDKNWLIRIILRHPSKSIVSTEANDLYTLVYEHIHQGNKGYKI